MAFTEPGATRFQVANTISNPSQQPAKTGQSSPWQHPMRQSRLMWGPHSGRFKSLELVLSHGPCVVQSLPDSDLGGVQECRPAPDKMHNASLPEPATVAMGPGPVG